MVAQRLVHIRVVSGDVGMELCLRVSLAIVTRHLALVDRDIPDLALISIGEKLGERDVFLLAHPGTMDDKLT